MRVNVRMACSVCQERNYTTRKNKKNNPDRLEFRKYCSRCKTHTQHKEAK